MTELPVFFHIAPDGHAEARLTQLFRLNGHAAALPANGDLARGLVYALTRGVPLPAAYPGVRLFTGLHANTPIWRPPIDAWRRFACMDKAVPQARFILTTRDLRGWLLERMTHDGGQVAQCHAHHLGVPQSDLPDIWARTWRMHLDAVAAHFGDDPRLIRIDLDRDSPADAWQRLSAHLPMPVRPKAVDWLPDRATSVTDRLLAIFDRLPEAPDTPDAAVAADIAGFCLDAIALRDGTAMPAPDAAAPDAAALSGHFCAWDGAGVVRDKHGAPRQFVVTGAGDPDGPMALARPGRHFKLLRAEAVITAALRLGHHRPLRIDMEDSRWFGSPQGAPLAGPVLCHNRRADARDAVLWPLPGQHDIGLPGFDPATPPDTIAYEDKIDRLVWRGMISGSEIRPGQVRPGPAAHVHLAALEAAGSDRDARAAAWDALCRTSRLAFVRRFADDPDFDLGVVMAHGFRHHAADPFLARYCTPRQGPAFFRRYRYQLCLTGYDHGSNFVSAIDSNGVLLAEDDGWQVFYSGRFRPWQHYIPVARHAADITEKLDWARRHPAECRAMSAAARIEAAHLRNPATRALICRLILDGLP